MLITAILLGAHLSFGILESYGRLLTAIAASFGTEAVLHRLIVGEWRNMSSAYISGISVGILVRSPFFWPYALCAVISIASKYVLRYKDQHLWNPSNFGIVAILILAPASVAGLSIQWGNNIWAMLIIWAIGSISIYKLKRFHICATYVLSFLLFAIIRSYITGDVLLAEISPITGPMYQLFVFFMITDPKTTVKNKKAQYLFAFVIGFVEFFFRLGEAVYAPFYALFVVGPIFLLIEMWWENRKNQNSISELSAQEA
ncbi:MAG: RnfABCDGE type electron transport complex subunit D [Balneolaceae bacterium]|nr:RnfABCDGE type electron transport complex subunit D [Balneolaceae bacterium]